MPKAQRKPDNFMAYHLRVVDWTIGYLTDGLEYVEGDRCCFEMSLSVELEEPVNGAKAGDITIYSDARKLGGELGYSVDKTLGGVVWLDELGASTLTGLLAAGCKVTLILNGERFRYRWANIQDLYWYASPPERLRSARDAGLAPGMIRYPDSG
jgi:hypothetical protein